MIERLVDNALAVAKESVKTITHESLNNIARLINGASALLLAILPGKSSILEGVQGWELRPTFRGPRFPRWMENGVSSFNEFIHELSMDSDTSSSVDYISGEEDDDINVLPASPSSQTSRLSRSNSFTRYDIYVLHFFKWLFSWVLWPTTFVMHILFFFYKKAGSSSCLMVSDSNLANHQLSCPNSMKGSFQIKDHVVHRTTDRRRGVIEDLQLATEVFIEAIFDNFHKAARILLYPSEVYRILSGWFSFCGSGCEDSSFDNSNAAVPTAILGNVSPIPTERETNFHRFLNMDARTCQDVITELGYPYEAIRVVTSDGYVLLMERIPRRDSRKVVYLQHGALDTSMGWISNGVVGSPAFAAYDQGYDVFLGNLRGLVSREHVDKNISSRRYWKYSINEHATQDVPTMIEKIHQIKTSELSKGCQPEYEAETHDQPYKLCAVSHSLGGAVMLMYVITRRILEEPHRLSRLVLLSPGGFHEDSAFIFTIIEHLLLLLHRVLAPIVPGIYIPTRFFRMLVNKLARDFQNYPGFGGLAQTLMSYVAGGDSSNWIGVIGSPHFNMYDMPGVSFNLALHFAQMKHARKFQMYDYGNPVANMEAYGSPEPLDLGQHYDLIDIPVDLVAGRKDKVIVSSMIRKHYKLMRRAGLEVSFNEFEYAHLDFTFSHNEELLAYVMSRLLLVAPPQKPEGNPNFLRIRKRSKTQIGNEETEQYREYKGR